MTKDPYLGRLYPASEKLPLPEIGDADPKYAKGILSCFDYPNTEDAAKRGAMAVRFGSNLAVGFGDVLHILRMGDQNLLSVTKDDGHLVISELRVIDDRDNQVVEMNSDGYSLDKDSHIRFKKPDRSTLIVEDHLGTRVLYVRYVNKNAILLEGIFRYPGFPTVTIDKYWVTYKSSKIRGSCTIGLPSNRAILDFGTDHTTIS